MDPEHRKQLVKRREREYPRLPGESFGEYGPQEAPEAPAKQRKKQNPKRESIDPNMLDDRIDMDTLIKIDMDTPIKIDMDTPIKNALSRYHGATPEQLESGKNWYSLARRQVAALAQQTGGDFSKAAGIFAALSPQLSWETNLNAGTHFLNARSSPV